MMSGDSPSTHTHEHAYEFKEPNRSLPTTSGSRCALGTTGAEGGVSASVMLEPKTITPADGLASGDGDLPSPNHRYNDDEAIETAENNLLATNRTLTADQLSKKLNGNAGDCTDSAFYGGDPKKKAAEEEEDGCGIKCLYYTMQCCECNIM